MPKVDTLAIVKLKKTIRKRKDSVPILKITIKTTEMKMDSDEYLANSIRLSSQRNSTSSSSNPLCFEACHSHSAIHYSNFDIGSCHLDDTKKTTSDDIGESQTHLFSSGDCQNVDEEVAWNEDELLNVSLVEIVLIKSHVDNLKENSFTIESGNVKVQSPEIQNNLEDSSQSSSKKKELLKFKSDSYQKSATILIM
ncbi:Hypothetical predicted protein [Octopus vulgaris]|uniref:Uncharacterized protein n=1 Tax=Octopus vulgaris TaxID=6645 RepID=A0AA36FFG1_OCTVU|nr:Hypothetical predicted protein [Octopus vulgaris]